MLKLIVNHLMLVLDFYPIPMDQNIGDYPD
jgi:hypothetical protein